MNLTKNLCVTQFMLLFKGISQNSSKKLCLILGYDFRMKTNYLKKRDFQLIDLLVREKVTTEKSLSFFVEKNISRLKIMKSYVGKRHALGLPTRGQRTHSNGSTARKLGFYKDVVKKKLKLKKKVKLKKT
jgi:small subunit ribosomal protein S13